MRSLSGKEGPKALSIFRLEEYELPMVIGRLRESKESLERPASRRLVDTDTEDGRNGRR